MFHVLMISCFISLAISGVFEGNFEDAAAATPSADIALNMDNHDFAGTGVYNDPGALNGYEAAVSLANDTTNVFSKALRHFKVEKKSKKVKRLVVVAILVVVLTFAVSISFLTLQHGRFLTLKQEMSTEQQIFGYILITLGCAVAFVAIAGFIYLLVKILK